MKSWFGGVFVLFLLASCQQASSSGPMPDSAAEDVYTPQGFPPIRIPADNPYDPAAVALGRALFYDPILSGDSTVSCASCHQQALAFTDGRALSVGKDVARRSAPSLVNVGFYSKGLFWDGRAASLEVQTLDPVRNPLEMDAPWPLVEARIRQHPRYAREFQQVFHLQQSTEIDSFLIAKALAQFQRTIISADAKFDRVMRGEDAFSAQEKRGWTIFFDASPDLPMAECNHCHIDPLFTDLSYQNNGITAVKTLSDFPDKGRGAITGNPYDAGKFRVPTLRNIMLTAPYMHDGRFNTLEEVLDHYIAGGHFAENLNPNVRKLSLTEADKADLLSFLQTLTDSSLLVNPGLSAPVVLVDKSAQ